ncbi:MAG: alpha/beta fold hydrolase [Desulfobacterium sp.]
MLSASKKTPWITSCSPVNDVAIQLFCFSYAGGGASVFRQWQPSLPERIQLCPVQLPGRENRISEPLITSLDELVDVASAELAPYLDLPFAFYGHSIGARIAFELARELRKKLGITPCCLIVSGSRAPHIPEPNPLHHLSDDAFMSELRRFSGTPEAVLQSKELMEMFLPILRADFAVDETYVYSEDMPLDCPIFVFGGTEDVEAKIKELEAWADHTSKGFCLEMIRGDHFFLQTERALLLQAIGKILLNFL